MPRLAPALVTFRDQVNRRHPTRSTASDGWIADARHRAKGGAAVTQHSPNADDVVCAFDVTEDLAAGLDCQVLLDELDAANDPRLFYAIHDGFIENSDDTRTPYTGENSHPRHLHLSVRWNRPDLYNDGRPWALPCLTTTQQQEDDMFQPGDAERLSRVENAVGALIGVSERPLQVEARLTPRLAAIEELLRQMATRAGTPIDYGLVRQSVERGVEDALEGVSATVKLQASAG